MTPELKQRIDCRLPPFDGSCIHNVVDLTLPQLRELLVATASMLSSSYSALQSFHDWHEHDGYIVDPKPDSWDSITSAIATDHELFDSRNDDFGVRIAFYPPTFDWLLRYNIDQDDESDYNTATCDYDLSVAKHVDKFGWIDGLLMRFPNAVAQSESQLWFKSNDGG